MFLRLAASNNYLICRAELNNFRDKKYQAPAYDKHNVFLFVSLSLNGYSHLNSLMAKK